MPQLAAGTAAAALCLNDAQMGSGKPLLCIVLHSAVGLCAPSPAGSTSSAAAWAGAPPACLQFSGRQCWFEGGAVTPLGFAELRRACATLVSCSYFS